jgi:septum formation protein
MLSEKLKNFNIILASGSPRRHHFFNELGVDFSIEVKNVEETYPSSLKGFEITDYLSKLKASQFKDISDNDIVVTSDTIVWKDHMAIEKPNNFQQAVTMLTSISGSMHEVITSVCFTGSQFQKTVHDITKVWFRELTNEEITHYIKSFEPYDKAGGYGIQEWIGYIGIERIEGCYFNVMGMPTRLVYKTLIDIASEYK